MTTLFLKSKNYILSNHLNLLIIILVIVATRIILNAIDFQTWRLCQGIYLSVLETHSIETAEEIFLQSCSREDLIEYLSRVPNSNKI